MEKVNNIIINTPIKDLNEERFLMKDQVQDDSSVDAEEELVVKRKNKAKPKKKKQLLYMIMNRVI